MGNGTSKKKQTSTPYQVVQQEHPLVTTNTQNDNNNNNIDVVFIAQFADTQKISYNMACDSVPKLLTELNKFSTTDANEILIILSLLNVYVRQSELTTRAQGDTFVRLLLENGLIDIVKKYYHMLTVPNDFLLQCDNVYPPVPIGGQDTTSYTVFAKLWTLLWNGTNISPDLCRQIVNNRVLDIQIELLKRKDIVVETILNDRRRMFILKSTSGILHNCFRVPYSGAKKALRALDVVEVLQRFIVNNKASYIKAKATICLAYCVNEDEMDKLKDTHKQCDYIVTKFLTPALSDASHKHAGFDILELIEALNLLLQHDSNKQYLVTNVNIIEVYTTVMKVYTSDKEEYIVALEGICLCSFVHVGCDRIKEMKELVNVVYSCKTSATERIRKAAAAILWNIGERPNATKGAKRESIRRRSSVKPQQRESSAPKSIPSAPIARPSAQPPPPPPPPPSKSATDVSRDAQFEQYRFKQVRDDKETKTKDKKKKDSTVFLGGADQIDGIGGPLAGCADSDVKQIEQAEEIDATTTKEHIMISYDHQHKDLVHALNRRLQSLGYTTWLDVEQMSGSTLEAMAEAVENARVVVVCYSERYKDSPNCRLEAEYVISLNKPYIAVRTEKYKPMGWLGMMLGTKLYYTCVTLADVDVCAHNVVKELGGIGRSLNGDKDVTIKPLKSPKLYPELETEKALKGWTHSDVERWLEEQDLGNLKTKLNGFDGVLLLQLRHMYKTAPTAFYQSSQQLMKIESMTDLMKLANAVDNLLIV